MGALIEHLQQMLRLGASEAEVVQAVVDELSGGDLLDAELADPEGARAEAAHLAAALDTSVLAAAQRGGLYTPAEIGMLPVTGAGDPDWEAKESVRFSCFVVAAGPLLKRMADASSDDRASAILDLAGRLCRVRMPGRR